MAGDDDGPLFICKWKYLKYDSLPEEVTFKLVAQVNKLGKGRNLALSSHFFHLFFKLGLFPSTVSRLW